MFSQFLIVCSGSNMDVQTGIAPFYALSAIHLTLLMSSRPLRIKQCRQPEMVLGAFVLELQKFWSYAIERQRSGCKNTLQTQKDWEPKTMNGRMICCRTNNPATDLPGAIQCINNIPPSACNKVINCLIIEILMLSALSDHLRSSVQFMSVDLDDQLSIIDTRSSPTFQKLKNPPTSQRRNG